MNVKAKDTVLVLSGKDAGSRGTVLSVDRAASRALVEGVNKMKKHVRADPRRGTQGGVLEREAPIHVSNLMVVCPQCDEPTRLSRERREGGRLVRKCKRCSAQVDKQ